MRLRILMVMVLLSTFARLATAQCEGRWMEGPEFGFAGLGHSLSYIRASVEWDPDGDGPMPTCLAVGGGISAGIPFVALWDGSRFHALSFPVTVWGEVRTMAVYQGRLVVGIWNQSPRNPFVFQWNSVTGAFEPIATGEGSALSMTVAHGSLYVGGYFGMLGGVAAENIARWNGTSWSAVGGGRPSGTFALITAANGDVVAGGYQWGVARFNGTSWTSLASTVTDRVRSLLEMPDGSIVAGGLFTSIGGTTANNIARWSNNSWQAMGAGSTASVRALAMWDGRVVAAMSQSVVYGVGISYTIQLGGWSLAEGWTPLGGTLTGTLQGSGIDDIGPYTLRPLGGRLFTGGAFSAAGDNVAMRVALMQDGQWVDYGVGFNGEITKFLAYDGGAVAIGNFTQAPGPVRARRIAAWNGAMWRELGHGFNGPVSDVVRYGDGLLACGAFTASGDVVTGRIARWDGESWQPFGDMNPGVGGPIGVVEGTVYAHSWSAFPPAAVVAWSDVEQAWTPLPPLPVHEGGPITFYMGVSAIMEHEGNVIVRGGRSTELGWYCTSILRSTGSAWESMVGGCSLPRNPWEIRRMWSVPQGGIFYSGPGIPLDSLWDGPRLQPPWLTGQYREVYALAQTDDGRMAASGTFNLAGPAPYTTVTSPVYLRDGLWQTMGAGRQMGDGAYSGTALEFVGNDLIINASEPPYLSALTTAWSRWTFGGVPWVAEHPVSTSVQCDEPASFLVAPASGFGSVAYRWQLEDSASPSGWLDLTDGVLTIDGHDIAVVSGASTPELTVTPQRGYSPFVIRGVVSNACGSGESRPASLSIAGCPSLCDPDVNCDGGQDQIDVACLILAVAGEVSCICQDPDFNQDGSADQGDVASLIGVVAGQACP